MGNANSNIFDHPATGTASFFAPNTSYAVLIPRPLLIENNGVFEICNTSSAPTAVYRSDMARELASTVSIVMFLGLLFLLAVAARSTNKIKWDFFRITGLYIVGTLGVPISVFFGPSPPGFNRIEGFGILVHNFAEWFIVGALWYGAGSSLWEGSGFRAILIYVWIMLTLISLLDNLSVLFLLLMIQGASLDWIMVYSFMMAGIRMSQEKADWKFFWIGFGGALTHILSIQPLFFGFALAVPILDAITIVMLVPTFMLYILFSIEDSPMPGTVVGPPKTGLLPNQTEVLWSLVNSSGDQELRNRGAPEEQDNALETEEKTNAVMNSTRDVGSLGYNPEDPKSFLKMEGSRSGLINHGMYFKFPDGPRLFAIIIAAGILTSIANSFFVWFSPKIFESRVKGWFGCLN